MREFEHITLARMLLAQASSDRNGATSSAIAFLDRLLEAADAGGRIGSVIEILVLQARAYYARGDTTAALAPLRRALTLAEPEGFVRIFVDGGHPMRELLRHTAGGDTASYVRRLLSAFDTTTASAPDANADALAEPLTPREVEVLRLIAAGMRNQEIADHLFLSVATVKRHIANAYGKLGAGHRIEALARASELQLL
jgi:LuxR family maltose regulon positive regulatory protein